MLFKYGTLRFYYDLLPKHFWETDDENKIEWISDEAQEAVSRCVGDTEQATHNLC